MNYGEIVKMIRKSKGLSQEQLASGIMSRSNLSNFESGNYVPAFDKVIELLFVLEIDLNEFLELSNLEYKNHQLLREQIITSEQIGDLSEIKRINTLIKNEYSHKKYFNDLDYLTTYLLSISCPEDSPTYDNDEFIRNIRMKILNNDTWFRNDLKEYNNYFHIFDLEENQVLYPSAIKKLNKTSFGNFSNLRINLSLNYLLQLLKYSKYSEVDAVIKTIADVVTEHGSHYQKKIFTVIQLLNSGNKTGCLQEFRDLSLLSYLYNYLTFT